MFVILDRDGTLLDFSEMFYRFILDLHRADALEAPSRDRILEMSYWQSIQAGELRIGERSVKDRIDDVPRSYMREGRLYPGAVEAVRSLAGAGLKLGLVSGWVGTRATEELLSRHHIREAFQAIHTRDDLPPSRSHWDDLRIKVALTRDALESMGRREGDPVFVVGDAPIDMAVGKRLGAKTVAVGTGNARALARELAAMAPDWVIPSVSDLPSILLGSPPGAPDITS